MLRIRVLVLAGLHPKHDNKMSGIFLNRRLSKLQEYGVEIDVIGQIIYNENDIIKYIRKILRKPIAHHERTTYAIDYNKVLYKSLPVSIGLLDKFFIKKRIGPKAAENISKIYNLSNYDCIHAYWAYPHGYIGSVLKNYTGLPLFLSVHGSDIHTLPFKVPRIRPYVVKALNGADKVFFNNHKLLEVARSLGYSANNEVILHNGVDTKIFYPINSDKDRKNTGYFDKEIKYVGFIGSMKWVKGVDSLPEIFRLVDNLYKKVKFIIIGDGELLEPVKMKCVEYKLDSFFAGQIRPEEIPKWMNSLDVLVLPSRNEGFPNVVLEAQACGCPIVGADTGGIKEAVGEGGIVVSRDASNFEVCFAEAIIRMLVKPITKTELRERAKQFDWDIIIKKQIGIYKEVLVNYEQ